MSNIFDQSKFGCLRESRGTIPRTGGRTNQSVKQIKLTAGTIWANWDSIFSICKSFSMVMQKTIPEPTDNIVSPMLGERLYREIRGKLQTNLPKVPDRASPPSVDRCTR